MRIKRKWQRIVDWTRGLLLPLHEDSGKAMAETSLVLALVAAALVLTLGVIGLVLAGKLSG